MMQRCDTRWLARSCAGLVMALLLGDALSPSAARAACGDHVRIASPSAANQSAAPADQVPHRQLPPPGPCDGPSCSRSDIPPLLPVAPPAGDSEAWGWLPLTPPHLMPCFSAWLHHGDDHAPPRPSSRIFHPPRA